MAGFAKLWSDIVDSTIWREDMPTKIVWITMLAKANKNGEVASSVPGLADASRVSLPECLAALEKLKSPDPYSRTKDFEGRRILEIEGGWLLLTYALHRSRIDEEERRIKTAERVRKFREELKKKHGVTDVTFCNAEKRSVTESNDIAEADTEAHAEGDSDSNLPPSTSLAGGIPKKKAKRTRDPLPLNRVGGIELDCFEEAKACWPTEITGFNDKIRSTETRKIPIGNIPQAQKFFHQLVLEGHATPQELYACAWVASNQWKKEGYLWVPHLSTFFGPIKETWAQFLPEAKKALEQLEHVEAV